jgi:serine/threonine-protein kinase
LKPLESNSHVERYLARDGRGQTVQLKVLSARAAADERARKQFYLEAQSASKLTHMNILATTKAEEASGVHFCVVEHRQDAVTLGELLDLRGWLGGEAAAAIADQIASALAHAHQVGVLHLQLQPKSVLIEPDGWVVVGDFGVDVERAGQRLQAANAQYTSPELAMGQMVDHRSDLYSLGAVLYEMLTDRTLFDSEDAAYIARKQMGFIPSPPHLISADVSESVSNVVMKLLERERVNRYANAAAFQAALDAAVNQV